MRIFIAAIVLAVAAYGTACAEVPGEGDKAGSSLFSEDGIYIAPGESHEVVIAGDCRLLTNRDDKIGYYITPSRHETWPDNSKRDPLEPAVTEAPCR